MGRVGVSDDLNRDNPSSLGTRIGTEIAGYRLESVIGRGGMSVIYLATQVRLDRKVALKLLASELAEDERFRERFIREAHLASEINHPNIIPIYDAGEDAGYLYLAMRYVSGQSLRELLKKDGSLGLGRLIYVIEQMASALDTAHAAGLVHRDVKPANILLEEASDHAYLTDFGVAKRTTARFTQTGMILGTFEYLAPEQIEALPVDARTDVYALGCTIYECITGALPFDRESEVAIMHAHLTAPPPSVTQLRPDLPLALNDVVAKALAKAPDDRYGSCGQLAAALRGAALRAAPSQAAVIPAPVADPEPGEEPSTALPVTPPPTTSPPVPASVAVSPVTEAESPSMVEPAAPAPSTGGGGAAPAGRRSGSSGRMPKFLAVGLAIAAAIGLGAGGYALVNGGDDNKNTASTGTMHETTAQMHTTTAATSTGMVMTESTPTGPPAMRLASFVAEHPSWQCSAMANAMGAAATKMCTLPAIPNNLAVSVYPTKAALHEAYAHARSELGSPRAESGACSATHWAGERMWSHGENERGGREFCLLKASPQLSRLVWYSDLGTPTLFQADFDSLDHRQLYFWWVNFRHDLF